MHCGKRELKWTAARESSNTGFFAACCYTKCPKMCPLTCVFMALFGSQKQKQLVPFLLRHFLFFFFNFFSPLLSFALAAVLQVHPEARTPITAPWGGFTDMSSLGVWQSAAGDGLGVAYSLCILKYINRFCLLLFSLTWCACSILGKIRVNPSGQWRIIW